MTIQRLLDALVDGNAIDWDEAESQSPDGDSLNTVRELRVIARILDAHQAGGQHANGAISLPFQWGPLRVDEFIARGAHGDVYRAWDPRLERVVALKLLHGFDEAAEQAPIAEGRLLARVRHPNVVTVYGADRVDGRAGVWMEFVNGRTVREQVDHDGPFTPGKAAAIASAVCSGLAAIHDAELIHRDVKAQNVVEDVGGRTILMDLGAGQDNDEPDDRVEGTPVYLAPELLKGGRATIASDVYATGVLLFYMLTGRYPVDGRSIDTLRQYFESNPNATARPDARAGLLPSKLARVITRSLSDDPAERFASARDMKAAIDAAARPRARRPVLAVAAVVATTALGVVAAAAWQRLTTRHIPFQAHDAVLVAAFENHTGDPVLDGTIDFAFQSELSNTQYVTVVSRDRVNDALRLMRRPAANTLDLTTARDVAMRDGDIRVLVAGGIDRMGSTYSLTARILNPATGIAVATFEERVSSEKELLPAARRESLAIRDALGEPRDSLVSGREALAKVATPSLHALQLYSLAARQWQSNDMPRAETYLNQALAIDPGFASAHLLLAWAIRNQRRLQSEYMPHADEALRLSSTASQPEQDFIVGSVHQFRSELAANEAEKQKETRMAVASYEALLAEQPTHQWVVGNLQGLYGQLGMLQDARRLLSHGADQRPLDFRLNAVTALTLFVQGDAGAAERYYQRAMISPRDRTPSGPMERLPFLHAFVSWRSGDAQATAKLTESVAATIPAADPDLRGPLGRSASLMLLSVGQTRRAEQIAESIADANIRFTCLIVALEARQDRNRLRHLLLPRVPNVLASVPQGWINTEASAWIMAGLLQPTHEVLRRLASEDALVLMVQSELAFAEGRYDDAIVTGRQSLKRQTPAGGNYELKTAEVVARSLRQRGDSSGAIALLERYTARREESLTGFATRGDFWISARLQLAGLYREVGRTQEAAAIEAELAKFLAVADSDHPLVLELKRRPSG